MQAHRGKDGRTEGRTEASLAYVNPLKARPAVTAAETHLRLSHTARTACPLLSCWAPPATKLGQSQMPGGPRKPPQYGAREGHPQVTRSPAGDKGGTDPVAKPAKDQAPAGQAGHEQNVDGKAGHAHQATLWVAWILALGAVNAF